MPSGPAPIETIRDAVAPVVDALGCRLYDVELTGAGKARTLRVTIDRDGGVDIDAITDATRAISPVLDALPALSSSYLLEVSSPGVERALRTPDHFRGAVGTAVSIKYHTEAGPRRVHGTLVDSDAASVVVDTDGDRLAIPLADITSARTVFEWGPKGVKA